MSSVISAPTWTRPWTRPAHQALDKPGPTPLELEQGQDQLGGVALGGEPPLEEDEETRLGIDDLKVSEALDDQREMSARELLLTSAFELTSTSEGGGPAFSGWGRFATGGFDAEVDDAKRDGSVTTVRLAGDVTTAFLGADAGSDQWLAGIAVAVSEGDGTYKHLNGDEKGEIESALTTLLPYGVGLPRNAGKVTPYAALSLGEAGNRTWRTGAPWQVAPEVALGLEATGGSAGDGDIDNTLMLRAQARF